MRGLEKLGDLVFLLFEFEIDRLVNLSWFRLRIFQRFIFDLANLIFKFFENRLERADLFINPWSNWFIVLRLYSKLLIQSSVLFFELAKFGVKFRVLRSDFFDLATNFNVESFALLFDAGSSSLILSYLRLETRDIRLDRLNLCVLQCHMLLEFVLDLWTLSVNFLLLALNQLTSNISDVFDKLIFCHVQVEALINFDSVLSHPLKRFSFHLSNPLSKLANFSNRLSNLFNLGARW